MCMWKEGAFAEATYPKDNKYKEYDQMQCEPLRMLDTVMLYIMKSSCQSFLVDTLCWS